jgi:predicted site-specific integrase-resolvase
MEKGLSKKKRTALWLRVARITQPEDLEKKINPALRDDVTYVLSFLYPGG